MKEERTRGVHACYFHKCPQCIEFERETVKPPPRGNRFFVSEFFNVVLIFEFSSRSYNFYILPRVDPFSFLNN